MLNRAKTLTGYRLNSRDGEIGKVKDFYFDDRHWTICYLVADTRRWLEGRQVLISPNFLGDVNRGAKDVVVELSKKTKSRRSPDWSTRRKAARWTPQTRERVCTMTMPVQSRQKNE